MNPQILRPIWLVTGSVGGALLIVSACSLLFNAPITADYLITGLIASMIVAPVTLGLLNHANRRALIQFRDRNPQWPGRRGIHADAADHTRYGDALARRPHT